MEEMDSTMINIQPTDEVFNDIKEKSVELWENSDNYVGYIVEKVDLINDLSNIKDNWSSIIGMFDFNNQLKLYSTFSIESLVFLYSMRNKYSIVFDTKTLIKIKDYINE